MCRCGVWMTWLCVLDGYWCDVDLSSFCIWAAVQVQRKLDMGPTVVRVFFYLQCCTKCVIHFNCGRFRERRSREDRKAITLSRQRQSEPLSGPKMTLTFDLRSWNIDKDIPRYYTNIIPKNKVSPTTGLGGVREHTNRQTNKQTDRGLTSNIK